LEESLVRKVARVEIGGEEEEEKFCSLLFGRRKEVSKAEGEHGRSKLTGMGTGRGDATADADSQSAEPSWIVCRCRICVDASCWLAGRPTVLAGPGQTKGRERKCKFGFTNELALGRPSKAAKDGDQSANGGKQKGGQAS